MQGLAINWYDLGRHAEAMKLYEKTLALQKSKLSRDDPEILMTMQGLAACYADLNRHSDAITLFEETLALRQASPFTRGPLAKRSCWLWARHIRMLRGFI